MHPIEYGVILATFMFINLFGLEVGMGGGVLIAMICFIYDYAKVPVVQRVKLRSNVIRSLPLSSSLNDLQDQIITLRCRGYVFFGSTLQIMDTVMSSVVLPPGGSIGAGTSLGPSPPSSALDLAQAPRTPSPPLDETLAAEYEPPRVTPTSLAAGGSSGGSVAARSLFTHGVRGKGDGKGGGGAPPPPAAVPSATEAKVRAARSDSSTMSEGSQIAPVRPQHVTRFILFDFTTVSGLDATAARSCFLNLCRTLTPLGITLVFGGVEKGGRVERLLIGHEILHVSASDCF